MHLFKIIILSLLITALHSSAFAEAKKIRIGVPTALTGAGAAYGQDVRDSLLFAVERFGNNKYELIFEDTRCNGREAVTATKKLVEIDKVDYIIGFACSGAALSALPMLEKAKIPTIIPCASSPKIAHSGDYIFRTLPSDSYVGTLLYDFVKTRHNKFAIITEETEYAQDLKNHFLRANKGKSIEISEVNFLPGTRDFRTLVLKLKRAAPEGLLVITQAENTFVPILEQMKQVQWKPQLYGFYWPGSPELLKLAAKNLEGIIYADTPALDDILTESGKSLYAEFQKKHRSMRSIEAVFATSLEAFRALDAAISSGKDVRAFLYRNSFDGVFGKYRFDKNGEIIGLRPVLKTIRSAKPQLLFK